MRVASVVGTRPQLIKAAALQPVLRARLDEVFIDTGQHWDDSMAGSFFRELGLARPDHALGVGAGTHAEQTAAMLLRLEPILRRVRPQAVLVFGDTNSTLAGALAAAKLGLPVAHVEAGLRSFDRRMPEELNRIVADHLATWCFAPTSAAVANLRAEGIADRVLLVGDLLQDLAADVLPKVRDPAILVALDPALHERARPGLRPGRYLFATLHRAENREPAAIARWTSLLRQVARPERPVVLALHPGTEAALDGEGRQALGSDVLVIEPQGYRTSLALQLHAAALLTDSGGIQREAAWLGVPCLVLRGTTEWTEALHAARGTMVLVGLDAERATAELDRLAPIGSAESAARERAARAAIPAAGAAQAIVDALSLVPPAAGASDAAGASGRSSS